jgi:hypothetical protein
MTNHPTKYESYRTNDLSHMSCVHKVQLYIENAWKNYNMFENYNL